MDPERICERCAGPLLRRSNESAWRWKRRRFCCLHCANSGKPIGSRTRYRRVGSRRDVGDRQEHRVVWEGANGPIPAGHVVHHRNHDKTDNRLENLELMSFSDHMRYHAQLRRRENPASTFV